MRKVIGIGETILDIIFKEDVPTAASPGGSTFNSLISLGRIGVPSCFISETGDDHVGDIIINFLKKNHVDSQYVRIHPDTKSPVSLAFLNHRNDAQYIFFKDHPHDTMAAQFPEVNANDIVLFGSFYAINPVIRESFFSFIRRAHEAGAILYYDVNFRSSHIKDLPDTLGNILENFSVCDIVRGSTEDFDNMFGLSEPSRIYAEKMSTYSFPLICTDGAKEITLFAPEFSERYPVTPIKTVSTIGAGDNFNAGIAFGLLKQGITKEDIPHLTRERWAELIECGQRFSREVCCSFENYVSEDYAKELSKELVLS
jgi:fructokinase